MKILMVCNTPIPEIAKAMGITVVKPESWIEGHIRVLRTRPDIQIAVCFKSTPDHALTEGTVNGIAYSNFHESRNILRYSANTEQRFVQIIRNIQPDIIHVFGTEYSHSLAVMNAGKQCGMQDRIVISIQGLVSAYSKHYLAGLPHSAVHAWTLRDIIRMDNIARQQRLMAKRGEFELEALSQAAHIIGRTDWDYAYTTQASPNAVYHFCNETLRKSFYENRWDISEAQRHSIFVSQCNYSIKGFHYMLEALRILKKKYPDVHLYTTGKNPLDAQSFLRKQAQTSYVRYIAHLLREYGLEQNVTFCGRLNEHEMCERFLRSHVSVLPSVIENSPNSLGEAMILGMPVVAADVGGVKSMITHNTEGYVYQHDAPYMLAHYLDVIFKDDNSAVQMGLKAREHALRTHDEQINARRMLDIYQEIYDAGNDI